MLHFTKQLCCSNILFFKGESDNVLMNGSQVPSSANPAMVLWWFPNPYFHTYFPNHQNQDLEKAPQCGPLEDLVLRYFCALCCSVLQNRLTSPSSEPAKIDENMYNIYMSYYNESINDAIDIHFLMHRNSV